MTPEDLKGLTADDLDGLRGEEVRAAARAARSLGARRFVLMGTVLACLMEFFGPSGRWFADAAGLWLVLGAPIGIWYGCAARVVSTREAAALVALGFALIGDMVELLLLNTLLPMAGDQHPLSKVPITATLTGCVIVLGAVLPEADPDRFAAPWRISRRELWAIGGGGALCLLLSVAGPIRINNGFSSGVSILAMVCVTALLVVLLARAKLSLGAIELGLYFAALSLLLLTSLRGWAITGHDIQSEYDYFELALGGERWDVHTYSNAYNACLSITILPVALRKLTEISALYIFKALLPVLFATTPVMVFRAVRNVAPHTVSVLSAIFFIMFPTFFSDMPYMGRQEMAFVLVGCAMLVVTERGWRVRDRRIAFLVLTAGTVLSHYSTSYVIVMVLGGAVAVDLCWRLGSAVRRLSRRSRTRGNGARARRTAPGLAQERSFVAWWMVPIIAGLAFLWAGPATGTGGQFKTTLSTALAQLEGKSTGQSGSSASYSLFGGSTESDAQRMSDYRAQTITQTAATRATGNYLPLSLVNQYATPAVKPAVLPLTSIGHFLQSLGIGVKGVNTVLRSGIAALLQVLILIGLLAVWLRRKRSFEPLRDQVILTIGALTMLAALTVVPQLSIDYSVLRGFQQGLFFFSPFMAAGLLWLVSWARRKAALALCAVVAALLIDLSGVAPRVTGGYAAQLSLSNSGQYYDLYDPAPAEQTAARWLEAHLEQTAPNPRKALVQTDAFTFKREQTILIGNVNGTIFPTQLNMYAYVLLGATTVRSGQVTTSYKGNLVTYAYPMPLLDSTYNEIYASAGSEIFQ
ncbi:DUF2206 domain-containing protein [Actinocrinis sp.]|uniref:DUF2206 domain-containing protein n=1 Tax=Actinocrinis sp. TaxID=1920516 RepID=UPI002D73FC97|nr:DUF2206 domain-containing protein [Actinocrinis sp.]HZP53368.1 DUF2206 domain-containing protein [Actinocrinis sp.]